MQIFFSLIIGFAIALIQLLLFREIISVFQGIGIAADFYTTQVFVAFALGIYITSSSIGV
jgi:hypothetical protein